MDCDNKFCPFVKGKCQGTTCVFYEPVDCGCHIFNTLCVIQRLEYDNDINKIITKIMSDIDNIRNSLD